MHHACADHPSDFRTRRSYRRRDRGRGQMFKRELIEFGEPDVEASQTDPGVGKSGIDCEAQQFVSAWEKYTP